MESSCEKIYAKSSCEYPIESPDQLGGVDQEFRPQGFCFLCFHFGFHCSSHSPGLPTSKELNKTRSCSKCGPFLVILNLKHLNSDLQNSIGLHLQKAEAWAEAIRCVHCATQESFESESIESIRLKASFPKTSNLKMHSFSSTLGWALQNANNLTSGLRSNQWKALEL